MIDENMSSTQSTPRTRSKKQQQQQQALAEPLSDLDDQQPQPLVRANTRLITQLSNAVMAGASAPATPSRLRTSTTARLVNNRKLASNNQQEGEPAEELELVTLNRRVAKAAASVQATPTTTKRVASKKARRDSDDDDDSDNNENEAEQPMSPTKSVRRSGRKLQQVSRSSAGQFEIEEDEESGHNLKDDEEGGGLLQTTRSFADIHKQQTAVRGSKGIQRIIEAGSAAGKATGLVRLLAHDNDSKEGRQPTPSKTKAGSKSVSNRGKAAASRVRKVAFARAEDDADATSSDDDDSEDDDADDVDDDDDNSDMEEATGSTSNGMFSIQNGNSNSVNDDDDGRAADRYFQDNHTRRNKKGGGGVLSRTSNATLANIARISHKDYQSLLAAAPQKHTAELAQLRQMHEFYFPQWLFELTSGFNLLYHGFGSKRRLLTKFAVHYLANARGWPVVVVNGYAPGASLKDVLLRIVNGVIRPMTDTLRNDMIDDSYGDGDGDGLSSVKIPSSGSPVQLLRFVMSFLDRPDCPFDRLCILLHNIDGPSLRASRTQQGFATLCSHPRVSLIASVDHLHAGLMWDTALAAKFRFVWHDVTTFESYDAEVACEQAPLLLVGSGDKSGDGYLSVRGVEFVLASLTANAKRIFRILAEAQIEQQQQQQQHSSAAASNAAKTTQAKTNAKTTSAAETEGDEFSSSGMSYSVLFNSSRDAFLVGNEVSFRAQLTEFRTHGIIRSHTDQFGTEMLHIPLASDSLAEILTGMEE